MLRFIRAYLAELLWPGENIYAAGFHSGLVTGAEQTFHGIVAGVNALLADTFNDAYTQGFFAGYMTNGQALLDA